MVFASPRTECAAVAEGNSPVVMPEDSALTLQISTLLSASWLRLGLLLVPELWVRWGVLHREPETLVLGCLHPSCHTFKGFAYLQRIWVFSGKGCCLLYFPGRPGVYCGGFRELA